MNSIRKIQQVARRHIDKLMQIWTGRVIKGAYLFSALSGPETCVEA